jgi:hypothetical protein
MYGVGDKVVALCDGPTGCDWGRIGDVFVVEEGGVIDGTNRLLRLVSRDTTRGNSHGHGSWWVRLADLRGPTWRPYERTPQEKVGEWIDEVRSWSCH